MKKKLFQCFSCSQLDENINENHPRNELIEKDHQQQDYGTMEFHLSIEQQRDSTTTESLFRQQQRDTLLQKLKRSKIFQVLRFLKKNKNNQYIVFFYSLR